MKKSVWIFLFAVLLPSAVLGWLALRSAEEQQIIFERRTAELYQKETESLAVTVRDTVDAERRVFGETVHRLLAKGDAVALARDFTNTLADAWSVKAVGFAIDSDGKLVAPSVASASKQPDLQRFLLGNGGFLTNTEPAIVYNWAGDNNALRGNKFDSAKSKLGGNAGAASNASLAADADNERSVMGRNAGQFSGKERAATSNGMMPTVAATPSGTLNFSGQQPSVSLFANSAPSFASAPDIASPSPSIENAGTIVLSGGLEFHCSVPTNVNAFDFTGVMSASGENFTGNALQFSNTNRNSQGFQLVPPPSGKLQESDTAVLLRELHTPNAPASPVSRMRSSSAAASALAGRRDVLAPDSSAMLSDAPTAPPDERAKSAVAPGGLLRKPNAMPQPPAAAKAMQVVDEPPPPLSPVAGVPMPAQPAGKDRAAPVPASAPFDPAPGAVAEKEEMPTISKTKKMPAPVPLPIRKTESAEAKLETSLAPNHFESAPKPTGVAQADKKSDDALTSVALATKSGVGSLALGNAINRQVEPQQMVGQQSAAISSVVPETAEFRTLTEDGDDGLIARFAQDKLNLIFWVRPPEAPEMIFGCLVEAAHFSDVWREVLERHHSSQRSRVDALESKPEFVLALLDDRGKPVATQPANAPARDWKRPFVASEIGEALPHWEAALYLASPTALAESARGLWRTLAFTIAGAVALIALGGWLVVADARRQLALAQQKTDFVSNVSHELKTPLTSIRMFAELMHDRPQPPEKQGQYLRIITVEAERLTRLINNVLDFAKIGRQQKRIERKPLDLCGLVTRVWESQELHLREEGFTTRWEAAPGPYPVLGDDDALAQVLVNLISNAEKYANGDKQVELHTWLDAGWVNVSVLDRGSGVPTGDEKKIFEAFYRAHDSLASGIQGSGLGLTLAQRIALEHGGEIKFERRDGGGSRFTLRLPLAEKTASGKFPE